MVSRSFFGKTIDALQLQLTLQKARHKAIASNIANAEVPGYQKIEVEFDTTLAQALEQKTAPLISSATTKSPIQIKKTGPIVTPHEYTISIDEEMVKLAENQINYSTSAMVLNRMFNILRTAIKGR